MVILMITLVLLIFVSVLYLLTPEVDDVFFVGNDWVQERAADMIGREGTRDAIIPMITAIRDLNDYPFNYVENILKLNERYPFAEEPYLTMIVEGIFRKDIRNFNRRRLVVVLEGITGEKFGYPGNGCADEYLADEEKEQARRSVEKIREWWKNKKRNNPNCFVRFITTGESATGPQTLFIDSDSVVCVSQYREKDNQPVFHYQDPEEGQTKHIRDSDEVFVLPGQEYYEPGVKKKADNRVSTMHYMWEAARVIIGLGGGFEYITEDRAKEEGWCNR